MHKYLNKVFANNLKIILAEELFTLITMLNLETVTLPPELPKSMLIGFALILRDSLNLLCQTSHKKLDFITSLSGKGFAVAKILSEMTDIPNIELFDIVDKELKFSSSVNPEFFKDKNIIVIDEVSRFSSEEISQIAKQYSLNVLSYEVLLASKKKLDLENKNYRDRGFPISTIFSVEDLMTYYLGNHKISHDQHRAILKVLDSK